MEFLETFAEGRTLLHRMDPRAKMIAAAAYSIAVAVITAVFPLILAVAFSFALVAFARLNVLRVARRLAVPNAFVLILWLTLPATVAGRPAATFLGLTLSHEGIDRCVLVTLKVNAIVASLIALLGTSLLLDLAHAARHLRVPDKLVMVFYFCVRYIHLIVSEFGRMRDAMKVRAFRPGTNARTYRTYANLMGMLLVRSYDRAERIYAAMLCRGFTGKFHLLSHFRMKAPDFFVIAGVLIFTALLVFLQWQPIKF